MCVCVCVGGGAGCVCTLIHFILIQIYFVTHPAKFIVVTRGPGVVSLQWVKDPLHYIGIYDNCVRVVS